ncbi:hypothetical protein [Variovorax sp. PBL-E5]|uniref:TubC N-terminal docking domain-related protein n=1 Tax=Variovorax sp. PBL-E5 TaxID=434014 RepID=UPI0013187857|nr:hypothetical protein [Variovorax sp. PBL-E5]VTU28429.1 hypothetical protein E5CHR_02607 [Variovorax sp. PBL-E5]
MSPVEICRAIYAAGMTVRADGAELVLKPADRLTPPLRELLVAHKPELIKFLRDAEHTAAELIEAALRVCDQFGDSEDARRQMRTECLRTPLHMRTDLLDHFKRGGA